jgi:hypothetical protein
VFLSGLEKMSAACGERQNGFRSCGYILLMDKNVDNVANFDNSCYVLVQYTKT